MSKQNHQFKSYIDPNKETLIAAREIPRLIQSWTGSKKKISHSTLSRWFLSGVAGVVLPSLFIAGDRFSSKEALASFLNEAARAKSNRHGRDTSKGVQAVNRAKEREAAELGI